MKKTKLILHMLILLAVIGCAKRGTISGGQKDTIAPVLKASFPKNFSTNFSDHTIKLNFDEYVKLKNVNKQLIISPPLSKTPQISPLTASKSITIHFLDTLRPNTTYSLNFGQSIEDNNEGNPYHQFKYVFSTGTYIDSLSVQGSVKDALEIKSVSPATVMLYEINDKYNDSLVFKQNPNYVAFSSTADGSFKLENIKAGKYHLIALEDKNSNYRFEPKTEKIAFHKGEISIPTDSVYQLKLFKEVQRFRIFKPSQSSHCSAIIGYEGEIGDTKFELRKANNIIPSVITRIPKQDSVKIWFKADRIEKGAVDSLRLTAEKGNYRKEFSFNIKSQKTDSLNITLKSNKTLPWNEPLLLQSNLPLSKFDDSKIRIIRKDSSAVNYTAQYDEKNLTLKINFTKEPLENYLIKLLPESIVDILGSTNKKPLEFSVETKNISDYGNLRLNIENKKAIPVIIELTDKNGEVKYSAHSENKTEFDFNYIEPSVYTLRLIYDSNRNTMWDPGNYLNKTQPEKVIYFPKEIDVRANWDVQQTFILQE